MQKAGLSGKKLVYWKFWEDELVMRRKSKVVQNSFHRVLRVICFFTSLDCRKVDRQVKQQGEHSGRN